MPLGKKFRLAVCCMVLAIAGTIWWSKSRPKDTVRAHLDAIRLLESSWARPSTFRDHFRSQTWLWYFRRRPSEQSALAEIDAHEKALLKLGYFEMRSFSIHRPLDDSWDTQLISLSTNFTFSDNHWSMSLTKTGDEASEVPITDWTMVMTGDKAFEITIMARPADMPIWSNIVQRFEQSHAR